MKRFLLLLLFVTVAKADVVLNISQNLVAANPADVVFGDPTYGITTAVYGDLRKCSVFELYSKTGSMVVYTAYDNSTPDYGGTPVAIALTDKGSTTPSTAVTSTTADGRYEFVGLYGSIKIAQTGATAVTGARLKCGYP